MAVRKTGCVAAFSALTGVVSLVGSACVAETTGLGTGGRPEGGELPEVALAAESLAAADGIAGAAGTTDDLAAGEGDGSETLVCPTLRNVTNFRATDGTECGRIVLTWTRLSEVSGAYSGYAIWRTTTPTQPSSSAARYATAPATASSFVDTAITPGQRYYYWIKAVCWCGLYCGRTSPLYSMNVGWAPTSAPLPAPVLAATDGLYCDRIDLSWTVSSESNIAGYGIWAYPGVNYRDGAILLGVTQAGTRSYSVTADPPAESGPIYFWVRSFNGCNAQAWSNANVGYTTCD